MDNQHPIGLGSLLPRARIIFLIITILAIASSTGAVYAGVKTGDLQKRFVEPVKTFGKNMVKSWEKALEPASNVTTTFTYTATSSSTIKVNDGKRESKSSTTNYVVPKSVYVAPSQNASDMFWQQAEENNKKFNEQVHQQNAAAQKAYQDRVNQMNAEYQQSVSQMNQGYQNSVNQAQQDQNAAIKKAQEDFDAFKKQYGL